MVAFSDADWEAASVPCWKIVTTDASLLSLGRMTNFNLGAGPLVQRGILVASSRLGVVGD